MKRAGKCLFDTRGAPELKSSGNSPGKALAVWTTRVADREEGFDFGVRKLALNTRK
jgi:hypothetical protein